MIHALVVAGGSGQRMQSNIPKQFLELNGKPILWHTLQVFLNHHLHINIVLVLPDMETAGGFMHQWFPTEDRIMVVSGGPTRFHSVQCGLLHISDDDGIVMIHDGVRPFVSPGVIDRCVEAALKYGSAVPCIDLKESLRYCGEGESKSTDRHQYKLIQTPQTFSAKTIQQAYQQDYSPLFTDEASVFETAGGKVHLVEGNEENIKITTPTDLLIASAFLEKKHRGIT